MAATYGILWLDDLLYSGHALDVAEAPAKADEFAAVFHHLGHHHQED